MSSPILSLWIYNWILPDISETVAKDALPITRLSNIRPAILTLIFWFSSVSLSISPYLACKSPAKESRRKSLGKATPLALISFNFSRLPAIILFSSCTSIVLSLCWLSLIFLSYKNFLTSPAIRRFVEISIWWLMSSPFTNCVCKRFHLTVKLNLIFRLPEIT